MRCAPPHALFLLVASLGACDVAGDCENRELLRLPSPDSARELIVFERDCGATTSISRHYSIVDPGQRLERDDIGNAYIEEWDEPLSVRWIDGRELAIHSHGARDALRRESRVGEIAIRYE